MIIKIGRIRLGIKWIDPHEITGLFWGRQLSFFISYETKKLRQFRRKIREAKYAREHNGKGGVGQTSDDQD